MVGYSRRWGKVKGGVKSRWDKIGRGKIGWGKIKWGKIGAPLFQGNSGNP